MGRILTLRGVVSKTRRERIFFFDSNVANKGWRVKQMYGMNMTVGRLEVDAGVHTDDRTIGLLDWDRNTTIACLKYGVNTGVNQSLIDLDHVVVGSMYITNLDDTYDMAYLIVLEEEDITPSENVIYQIKEMAQSSDT